MADLAPTPAGAAPMEDAKGRQVVRVAGVCVLAVALFHTLSLATGFPKHSPGIHVGAIILGYTVALGYVTVTSPQWRGVPMQLVVLLLVSTLDWFSFHEDKSRFSEEPYCISRFVGLPSCRDNAQLTGHLAHWGDTIALFLLGWAEMGHVVSSKYILMARALLGGCLGLYGVAGMVVIHRMTTKGSVSDLRHRRTDAEKCKQARIMRDTWRGALNEVITVLGILCMWQVLIPPTTDLSGVNPLVRPLKGAWRGFGSGSRGWAARARAFATIIAVLGPTAVNFVNTSAQHGKLPARTYGLPECFDDPEDREDGDEGGA